MKLALALSAALTAFVGGTTAHGQPASPGAIRIVENGDWVYFREHITATATVTVSGCYKIAKNPNGLGHVITMTWSSTCPHTFLDANVTHYELRAVRNRGVTER